MKSIFILIGFLTAFFIIDAKAQLRPAQAQYLQEKGAFLNPSYESGFVGWTITGCSKSLVNQVPYLGKTLKLTCAGEAFSIKQETTALAGSGMESVYSCKVKASASGARIRPIVNGTPSASLKLITAGDFEKYQDDFIADATSDGLEIYSASTYTGDIYLDDCYIGPKPDGYLPYELPDLSAGKFLYTNGNVTSWLDIDERTNIRKDNLLECGTFDACSANDSWTVTTDATLDDSGGGNRVLEKGANNASTYLISGLNIPASDYVISASMVKTTNDYLSKPMQAYCEIRTARPDVFFQVYSGGVKKGEQRVDEDNRWNYYKIDFTGGETNIELKIDGQTPSQEIIRVDNCFLGKGFNDNFYFEDFDDTPIGTILSYSSDKMPDGYLIADGACLSKSEYSALYGVIENKHGTCDAGGGASSGFNIPDLRGKFIRGVADGSTADPDRASRTACTTGANAGDLVGSCQDDLLESHAHNYVASNYDTLRHSPAVAYTNASGIALVTRTSTTAGGSETRPTNVYMYYIIKVKGKSPSYTVAQKALSPDKAGFVIFSATEGEIEGHLIADGRCVLKSDYPDYVANVPSATDCTITTTNDGVNILDLQTDNRFIRSSGGALTTGTTQTSANLSHTHKSINSQWANKLGHYSSSAPTNNPQNGSNVLTYNGVGITAITDASGTTESRPNSIVLTAYVRMVDRDRIYGDFDAIEEVSSPMTKNDVNEFEISFNYSSGVSSSLDDVFGVVSSITDVGTSTITINIDSSVFTNIPSVKCEAHDSSGNISELLVFGKTTSLFNLQSYNFTGGSQPINGNIDCEITKLGSDFIKDAKGRVLKESAVQGFQIGDCKMSLLDDTAFNNLHTGSWVKMTGQDITGSKLADVGGFTTMPDAVTNGTFFRQVGGLSGALRAYQADDNKAHTHTINIGNYNGFNQAFISRGNNVTNGTNTSNSSGGAEARPHNISMNFYCRID